MSRTAKNKGRPVQKPNHNPIIIAVLALVATLIGLWLFLRTPGATPGTGGNRPTTQPQSAVQLPHIHGMGFSGDGRQLMVAAHDGLRVFEEHTWSIPQAPAHDYMGYTPVDTGFYSSGHPQTLEYTNPFGLIKSTDGGKTLTQLGFEGESDFHTMGVGYKSHAIYVFNYAQNSRLAPGLHYSLDDGKTWQQSAMQGVTAQPSQLAVHPTEVGTIALATPAGLLLSTDSGNTFKPAGEPGEVLAVAFTPDGTQLLVGGTRLMRYTLASTQLEAVQTPAIPANDAISAITVNPVRPDELAYATYGRDIQLSRDGGQTWVQLARLGQGLTVP